MKKFILLGIVLLGITYSNEFFSQSTTGSESLVITPLTDVMMKKYYSAEEIKQMSSYKDKLKLINYEYSKSFEVVAGQQYSTDQLLKFDVLKYRLNRKLDETVVIYDPESGLNIMLYSINTIEDAKKNLVPSYQKQNEQLKKTSY